MSLFNKNDIKHLDSYYSNCRDPFEKIGELIPLVRAWCDSDVVANDILTSINKKMEQCITENISAIKKDDVAKFNALLFNKDQNTSDHEAEKLTDRFISYISFIEIKPVYFVSLKFEDIKDMDKKDHKRFFKFIINEICNYFISLTEGSGINLRYQSMTNINFDVVESIDVCWTVRKEIPEGVDY